MLWDCLKDWHMWPLYLIGLSWTIPNVSISSLSIIHRLTISADATNQLFDAQPQGFGFRYLHNQPSNYPLLCALHYPTTVLDLAL